MIKIFLALILICGSPAHAMQVENPTSYELDATESDFEKKIKADAEEKEAVRCSDGWIYALVAALGFGFGYAIHK